MQERQEQMQQDQMQLQTQVNEESRLHMIQQGRVQELQTEVYQLVGQVAELKDQLQQHRLHTLADALMADAPMADTATSAPPPGTIATAAATAAPTAAKAAPFAWLPPPGMPQTKAWTLSWDRSTGPP